MRGNTWSVQLYIFLVSADSAGMPTNSKRVIPAWTRR